MNKTIIVALVLFLFVNVAIAYSPPTTWGAGYKMWNVSGTGAFWDMMGGLGGFRNGSITQISAIQFNGTNVTPAPVNGTVWMNSTSGLINYNWNGVNYSLNATVI